MRINIRKFFNKIMELNYRYLFSRSIVRNEYKSTVYISKNSAIINSTIYVTSGSTLIIGENCILKNLNLYVKGKVILDKNNIIDSGYGISKLDLFVDGNFILGSFNRLRSKIWVRFNAKLQIGNHNNINEDSEIRCDESVTIGHYNQISYKCMIWDTNTHNIYADDKRRELTDQFFPIFGYEFEKPKTKPVTIGNDCWIAREVAVLKGVILQNAVVVGFRTTLSNCEIISNKVVVPKIENSIYDRI